MSIHLTPEQLAAIDAGGEATQRVVDPRTNVAYVLLSEAEYEVVRDVLEEEKRQRAIHAIGLRNAIGRMGETP